MKKKEYNEKLRKMSVEELKQELEDLRKEKISMDFQKLSGGLRVRESEGVYSAYVSNRKKTARCYTELNKRVRK